AWVLERGVEVGLVTSVPTVAGPFSIPLAGVQLAPGDHDTLEVRFGVESSAPLGVFELMVPTDGVLAYDINLGTRVAVGPDTSASFPLSSGIAELIAPARELAVGFAEHMPAVLVADGNAVPVATLTLHNSLGGSQILVDHLDLEAADRQKNEFPIGDVVTRIAAYVADTLWATTTALAPGDTSATLTAVSPLGIDQAVRVPIELRLVPRAGATRAFRVGCEPDDIGVVQPGNSLLTIAVVAEQGQTFPFWTELGGFTAASLSESYSNFPNPFAAGRAQSQFAFYLRSGARVTLALWTVRGDKVKTLLAEAPLAAGLHQDVSWDGRNQHGDVVTNGAYIAELRVVYDDGSSERELRKVAVVR
ncbi:MAG TPA: hypothetical protein VLV15_15325, partial [Dongiaceae bacterium]|nr:hypothetical protein [Dongiaceae bacterium]